VENNMLAENRRQEDKDNNPLLRGSEEYDVRSEGRDGKVAVVVVVVDDVVCDYLLDL
jgi:hypothetical protein